MPPSHVREEGAVAELVAAMRRTGDEAQWTQMIAATARAADGTMSPAETFATRLAQILLAAAPNHGAALALGPPPADLRLRAERLYGRHGIVDLVFSDPLGQWVLLAELKLHSGYGDRQISRYLAALDTIPAPAKALVAVTKFHPVTGEEEAEGDPRWLGSVRWRDIFAGLRALPVADAAPDQGWRAALDLLSDQGDFGLMNYSDDVMAVWNRRAEADRFVRNLLATLGPPIELIARDALAGTATTTIRMMMSGRSKSQPIVGWHEKPHIDYAIPTSAQDPRLRVQFMTGPDHAFFTVESRYQHPQEDLDADPRVAEAFAELLAAGFEVDNDGYGHYCARIVPVDEWMGADAIEKLLAIAKDAVGELVSSGIFTALEAHVRTTPQSQPLDESDPTQSQP